MASQFQPPPTYAEVILVDPAGRQPPKFNPIWLKWFLDLVKGLSAGGAGGGTVTTVGITGTGITVSVTNPTTAVALSVGPVTTNANLTGPITSVGNATALAVQTGTGTTIVVNNTPTLITPVLGVATATSINFGQTALSYYGEGTWTAIDSSGASLVFTTAAGTYTRIGRLVVASAFVGYPVTANGAAATIGGFPFAVANNNQSRAGHVNYDSTAAATKFLPTANTTTGQVFNAVGGAVLNSAISGASIFLDIIYPVT